MPRASCFTLPLHKHLPFARTNGDCNQRGTRRAPLKGVRHSSQWAVVAFKKLRPSPIQRAISRYFDTCVNLTVWDLLAAGVRFVEVREDGITLHEQG